MLRYEEIFTFDHLMQAHKVARLGKRGNTEGIEFEADLLSNIANLHQRLMNGTYHQRNYYHFTIYDPKVREIYALHYIDRIVQHCLCDNLLAPWFDTHVIYDNAACRIGKGTHFAMNRMDAFLHEHYKHYGTQGYILKCDISKYFNNIDHEILKGKLFRIFRDERVRSLLNDIIDSYEVTPGKGIPLGNQTSQWFAIWYIDELDRYVKEQRRIKHYTRYMDDFILIHPDKTYLMETLQGMEAILKKLGLSFNSKTQVFPINHGVEYLGWRFYLTDSGAVVRRLKKHSKIRWQHRLRKLKKMYAAGEIDIAKIKESIQSFANHMSYGNTWKMHQKEMNRFVLRKNHTNNP